MHPLVDVKAREVLDSRGNPTVEADVILEGGFRGRASVPSGASTGIFEAFELRDGDKHRFNGKGVTRAIENIHSTIKRAVTNNEWDQETLDARLVVLDGTDNKSNLGANAILAVSMAFSKAAASREKMPLYRYFKQFSSEKATLKLPVPLINILNGGAHAAHSTDIQEYMIVPHGAPTFAEALRYGAEVFQSLKKVIGGMGFGTTVGDEGGFAAPLKSNRKALDLLMESIQSAGYVPGKDISISIDAAASEFYNGTDYVLTTESKKHSADEMIGMYSEWAKAYPLVSIEDGVSEKDWDGSKKLTAALGNQLHIVGDDLFVTNFKRLLQGIETKAANAILVKLNQIGTVSDTMNAVNLAHANGWRAIVSHRSGETEDTTIADLAVGLGAGLIKTGSVSRGERTAKYNQLLRIEEELGAEAVYEGNAALKKKV